MTGIVKTLKKSKFIEPLFYLQKSRNVRRYRMFKIASKYFDLLDNKMIEAFVDADIDKLFAVF